MTLCMMFCFYSMVNVSNSGIHISRLSCLFQNAVCPSWMQILSLFVKIFVFQQTLFSWRPYFLVPSYLASF